MLKNCVKNEAFAVIQLNMFNYLESSKLLEEIYYIWKEN